MVKRIARSLTPPILWDAVAGILHRPGPKATRDNWLQVHPEVVAGDRLSPLVNKYLVGDPVFAVPVDRLRYPGGIPYRPETHHFLMYYRSGIEALREYYRAHQPTNVLQRHFLPSPAGKDVPDGWAPWLACQFDLDLEGECGLGLEHGEQSHGPVSEQKLRLEARRLDAVLASISQRGLQYESGRLPRGDFLLGDDGEWAAVVREGFHRVAALVHLGFTTVPMRFHPSYPRVVPRSESPYWPMVVAGSLTEDEALAVFDRYVANPVAAPPESYAGPVT